MPSVIAFFLVCVPLIPLGDLFFSEGKKRNSECVGDQRWVDWKVQRKKAAMGICCIRGE